MQVVEAESQSFEDVCKVQILEDHAVEIGESTDGDVQTETKPLFDEPKKMFQA